MINRHKKKSIILTFILSGLFSCVLLLNVCDYLALKNKAAYYLDKNCTVDLEEPVDLVGLLDSYGVPYSPLVDKSFFDYLEDDIEKSGLLSSSLDLYGLYVNKTWQLSGIYRNEVTIGEMKTMQNFGIDFVRHKYGKERIREDLVYTCDESIENITVATYYSELKRPIVLYSCAANDLFYYFNTSLESLSPAKLLNIIMNFGSGLSLLESEVKSNLETLTTYNPNAVIIVMGLYVPSDNFFFQQLGKIVVGKINRTLESVCSKCNNAYYADVSCLAFEVLDDDFHPNEKGHIILKGILESLMSSIEYNPVENMMSFNDVAQVMTIDNRSNSQDITLQELLMELEETDLPQRDYVECAVAFENVLLEKGKENISLQTLQRLKHELEVKNAQKETLAMEILVIERKIHDGVDGIRPIDRAEVQNDKLSLISYLR